MRNHRSSTLERLTSYVALAAMLSTMACRDATAPTTPSSPPDPPPVAFSNNSPLFYNVQLGGQEGTYVNVYFQYSGTMNPIVEVGTTWVPAKKLSNGYWIARIADVVPHIQYTVKIYTLEGMWTGSVKTYKRRVTLDLDWVHVNYDGDWGANCGEFEFGFKYVAGNFLKTNTWGYRHVFPGTYCIDSGYGQGFPDSVGTWVFDDYKANEISIKWEAYDRDGCGIMWSPNCGDYGSAATMLLYGTMAAGTHKFKVGSAQYSGVDVVWEGTVKISYHAW